MVRTSTRMLGERLVVLLRWVPAHLPGSVRLPPHGGDLHATERVAVAWARDEVGRALELGQAPVRRILA